MTTQMTVEVPIADHLMVVAADQLPEGIQVADLLTADRVVDLRVVQGHLHGLLTAEEAVVKSHQQAVVVPLQVTEEEQVVKKLLHKVADETRVKLLNEK